MSNLSPRYSSSKKFPRFSREGFTPLPGDGNDGNNMSSNDATIDIPLEQVQSNGGGFRRKGTALRTNTHQSQAQKKWQIRGRRHKPDPYGRKGGRVGYDGEEDEVGAMGKVYRTIMDFSTLTRYFFYTVPLALIFAAPIIITAVTNNRATIGNVRVLWFFTWIEIVWLSLWVSKAVAHYLPYIYRVLAGVVSSGVRKYSQVIKALEIPLSLVGWAVTALATFKPLMTRNPDYQPHCNRLRNQSNDPDKFECASWIGVVQNILAATVIAAVIYLAEKFLVQLISISYHRKQFNSRIKQSKHSIWILGLLYDASRELFPQYCNEFIEEDYTIADQLDLSTKASNSKRMSQHLKSGSHTPIRIIQDIGHAADKVTSIFGHVAQEVTGKQVFNPNSAHSIVIEALEKNRTAEALAKRIWMSFVVEGRDALLPEDVIDVMGPQRKTEAEEAFWAFDQDGNGDVSLDEFILTVTQWGRDRKSIASSMHDVDQAINVLDQLLVFIVLVITVLVFVAFLNSSFVSTLATTGTALLSLSFVFAASAQEVLGSCIFLFVKHPFDIGDRVDLGTTGCINQEQFVVEHISLLFTVFRHVQGVAVGRMCQIPNIALNTLWVENISRSKAMTEQLSIDIAFETSFDDLQVLKNELLNFVTDKDNSRDYQPTVDVDVLGTSDQSKMSLMVEVKHKSNWANEQVRRTRRTKFMCALISALKTVPIYPPGGAGDAVGSAALPSYSVAISHQEAKEHADVAAEGREKARLVSSKKIEEAKNHLGMTDSGNTKGAGMTQSDEKIASTLTTVNPAVDPVRDETWAGDDSITLGERPSFDRQDLEDVRGMLRRESTRGKRKVSHEYQPTLPPIPTINEPDQAWSQGTSYPLPTQQASGYENQRPTYSTTPAQYRPPMPPQPVSYSSVRGEAPGQPVQMSQLPPARSPSNPYRTGNNRPAYGSNDDEDEWGMRPYSGV